MKLNTPYTYWSIGISLIINERLYLLNPSFGVRLVRRLTRHVFCLCTFFNFFYLPVLCFQSMYSGHSSFLCSLWSGVVNSLVIIFSFVRRKWSAHPNCIFSIISPTNLVLNCCLYNIQYYFILYTAIHVLYLFFEISLFCCIYSASRLICLWMIHNRIINSIGTGILFASSIFTFLFTVEC